MKTGIIQLRCTEDVQANRKHLEENIARAAAMGTELVVLQELHDSLYFCQVESTDNFDLAVSIPGPVTEHYASLAKQHGIVLVTSLFEKRAAGLYHNTAVVFEKDGSIAGRYRKMHIPDDPAYYEKFYFTPGDLGFHPIQTSVGRLGVQVCWDQWYPEGARLMALQGADMLIYPLPVVSVNRVGYEPDPSQQTNGIQFWGSSFVAGPQGEILHQASQTEEEVTVVDIDMKRSENVRRWWPFLRDRRIEEFAPLTRRFID